MDDFERRYQLCRSDSTTSILSPLRSLSLIPGPNPVAGEMSSVDLHELSEHSLDRVRAEIRDIAGMVETTFDDRPGLSLFEWRRDDRSVVLEVGEFEDESPIWMGSAIETDCFFSDLLELWTGLQRRVAGAWLHNADCWMFSPEMFVRDLALPALAPGLRSSDEATRVRAQGTAHSYERAIDAFRQLASI